jgi:hypothetical protein
MPEVRGHGCHVEPNVWLRHASSGEPSLFSADSISRRANELGASGR